MLYLEGEASMSKFTGKDGTAQQSLNIVQRMYYGMRWFR